MTKARKVLRSDLVADLMLSIEDLSDEDICELCKKYMGINAFPCDPDDEDEDEDGEEYFMVSGGMDLREDD